MLRDETKASTAAGDLSYDEMQVIEKCFDHYVRSGDTFALMRSRDRIRAIHPYKDDEKARHIAVQHKALRLAVQSGQPRMIAALKTYWGMSSADLTGGEFAAAQGNPLMLKQLRMLPP